MNFGEAIEGLKQGKRVSRAGWNGKGIWLSLTPGTPVLPAEKFWSPNNRAFAASRPEGRAAVLPCISIRHAGRRLGRRLALVAPRKIRPRPAAPVPGDCRVTREDGSRSVERLDEHLAFASEFED